MRFAGLGIQLAASIVLFLFLGRWLDGKLGTEPVLTILGAFLGFGGTMYSLIRTLNAENRDAGDRKSGERDRE